MPSFASLPCDGVIRMPLPRCSDEDFIALFTQFGATQTARQLGIGVRSVYKRRDAIEAKTDRPLLSPASAPMDRHPERQCLDLESGTILIASDAHYWPGDISPAHRAFVKACSEFQPKIVVLNGDVFDGASVSRHAPIGWEDRPTVQQELEACQERVAEIKDAAPGAKLVWTLGNHDARFESRLAQVAPEFSHVNGVHLKDHFDGDWLPCWSCWVNDEIVIKHRWKGGIHATHNNTVNSGKTMVTGHLHSLKVTPFSDYNGTRWGVDTGTLAHVYGAQFRDYMEDNPRNWRSGFAVLTVFRGELLWPEVVHVRDEGRVEFRGKVYEV